MATLEKIRSKSVLLIIIIGVALLAFIIGDAITNSRNLFGDQSTVAKVGGKKIDYTDYVQKREELNSQLEMMRRQNNPQANQIDPQTLSHEAIQVLINEQLIDEAVKNAGIQTSSSQLKYYILDRPVNTPALNNLMMTLANSGFPVANPAQAYDIIFNPQNHGLTQAQVEPLQAQWVAMENETSKLIARNTYQRLLTGTIRANKLDKKSLYNDYVSTRNVDIAFSPYGQLDPKTYVVSENAVKAEYEKIKGRYKVDELTKDVAFIAISVQPSEEDRNNANLLGKQAVEALNSPSGLSKELRKEGLISSMKQSKVADLPAGPLKDFVASASIDSVKLINQGRGGFTAVKLKNRTNDIDSIQINYVEVASVLVDDVKSKLKNGLAVDSLNTVFSADSVRGVSEEWIALYNQQGWNSPFEKAKIDSLINAGGQFITMMETPQGSILAQLVNKSNAKDVVEYEEVVYELKPSSKTLNEQKEKLDEFLQTNTTTKDFIANAAKAGFNISNISLSASSPAVPQFGNRYYPESRQVVRWVMIDGKPGQVSHYYESKDATNPALYAVAIIDEYDDYKPLTNQEVNAQVTERVRRSMAGDALIKQYKPKAQTVASAAQAMNVEAKNDSTFRFARNSKVPDAAIMGRIAGSKPGNNVVLVKGDQGVYAYRVISAGTENFEYNDEQYDRQYNQLVQPDFFEMLKGNQNIVNNIYKFEAGD